VSITALPFPTPLGFCAGDNHLAQLKSVIDWLCFSKTERHCTDGEHNETSYPDSVV
jgi:hypothetical protein